MELYAKGQLSFLILTCLQERDFYGLDIISEISARSYGKINLKKPSVYSNLTRMEKQNYVSSYLQSSNYGPNRKYYSLTEKGRGFYQELKAYFDMNKIDVFRDFADIDALESPIRQERQNNETSTEKNNEELMNKEVSSTSQSDEYFDFSNIENDNEDDNVIINKQENDKEDIGEKAPLPANQSTIIEHIYPNQSANLFNNYIITNASPFNSNAEQNENDTSKNTENIGAAEKKDDAVLLPKEDNAEEYNQRLYDISKDINKIKRKRSFAEDQIAIAATDPLIESNDKKRASREEFKNSILENKMKYRTTGMTNVDLPKSKSYNNIFNNTPEPIPPKVAEIKQEVKDDAKLITGRIDENSIGKARKIEPPRLKIVSENTKDTRLPAPKRDTSIDPSHREILNKLYSKTKDSSSSEIRDDAIYDYNDLKEFYESQNISFNIYKKANEKKEHNTNLIYLLVSFVTFLVAAVSSTCLFLILHFTHETFASTNFLYILLPALLLIDVAWKFYNYKMYSSWLPNQINPNWKIWAFFLLSSCIVVGLNLIFGVATKDFVYYATTLILPIIILFIVLPLRYYIKKFALVKFWK